MIRKILFASLSLMLASNVFGFNLDPLQVDLKLKKSEKKEVLFRVKNIYAEPIIVEISAKEDNLAVQIKPKKLKVAKNGYTYVSLQLKAPADAERALADELTFKVSGVKKGSKINKSVIVPVSVEIYAENADKKKQIK